MAARAKSADKKKEEEQEARKQAIQDRLETALSMAESVVSKSQAFKGKGGKGKKSDKQMAVLVLTAMAYVDLTQER